MLSETVNIAKLPKEIFKSFIEYLDAKDTLSLASTCKNIKHGLDLSKLDDNFSNKFQKKHHWRGEYNDRERLWFRFNSFAINKNVHTVLFRCTFHDQGWGNRKSKLIIYEKENFQDNEGKMVAVSPIAEHHSTSLALEFQPKPEKKYTMSFIVGGGGGHELFVHEPSICILFFHNRGFTQAAKIYQQDSFFMRTFVTAVIDSFLRRIERNEILDDEELVTSLSTIGINPTNIDSLSSLKQFLHWLAQMDAVTDTDMHTDNGDELENMHYHDDSDDYEESD